jgi:hypothetical protein
MDLVMLRLPIGDHKSSGGIASIDIPAKSALHRPPMNLLYNLDQQGVHVGAHRYVNLSDKCTKSRNASKPSSFGKKEADPHRNH